MNNLKSTMTKANNETLSENAIVRFLRNFNKWRRGSEDIEQPNPSEIGVEIDLACCTIERLDKEVSNLRLKVAALNDENKLLRTELAVQKGNK